MRSIKGRGQTNSAPSREEAPTCPVHLLFQQRQPCGPSPLGTSGPPPGHQKIRTFCVSWVSLRPQASILSFLLSHYYRYRNGPLSSGGSVAIMYTALKHLCGILLFTYFVNVSTSGFLTTGPSNERFQIKYYICREFQTQENAASHHYSTFLKSSLSKLHEHDLPLCLRVNSCTDW